MTTHITTAAPAEGRNLPDLATTLTETDAHALLDTLASRFGWSLTLLTRADADVRLNINPDQQMRQLTDAEWARVTATAAWTGIRPAAHDYIDDQALIDGALIEAGLECVRCGTPLHDSPGSTGYLCDTHRTGPHGEPVVIHPDTNTMYWLAGDALHYAEADPRDPALRVPHRFDWDDDSQHDTLTYLRAVEAEKNLLASTTARAEVAA